MSAKQRTHKARDRFKQGRDLGCEYLKSQLRADDGFGAVERGLADYYKVPLALMVCGASAESNRLLDWIRRSGMTAEGDFGPRLPETVGYPYIYYNIWVIIGAHRQGHFDLSQKGMDFVLRFFDRDSGGFCPSPDQRTAEALQDLWVVSGGGQAALYTGRMEAALGVGCWMKRLMDLQPNFPKQLYSVYSRAGGLHTRLDPAEDVRFVVNANAERDEYFFHPGIAAGFLANLFKATRDQQWLDLAEEYMRMTEIASDFNLKSLRAGKVAWAAANLYTVTGKAKYADLAAKVGDNILAVQTSAGPWKFGQMSSNDATAEMVVWLDEVHQAIG
ncbi:MAG: hypothetical protein FJW26_20305 [Acidimicrobiia bacterium]|nr:hypothetical protein [Acidimicrobiia bacterium]